MESAKIKRTTNREQFREMVELMKTEPDIARNLTKKSPEQQQEFWERLQTSLNSMGPPFKEISEWRKVWTDFKSSIKKKTREQFREMVELMKTEPDIARNLTKKSPEQQQEFWERLQTSLNSMGPPFKEISEWRKVWTDFKSSIKKKIVLNKKSQNQTGGGAPETQVVTELEEEVCKLVCMEAAIEGVMGTRPCGLPKKRKMVPSSIVSQPSCSQPSSSQPSCSQPSCSQASSSNLLDSSVNNEWFLASEEENAENLYAESPKKRSVKSTQIQLLKEQIALQNKHFNNMQEQSKDINKNVLKLSVTLERLEKREEKRNEILESLVEETKRQNKALELILVHIDGNRAASEFSI